MSTRGSLALVLGLMLAFAGLVVLGAALNGGYSHSRDFISSLAGRGAEQAWIGIVAFVCFAAAHAVAALRWRRTSLVVGVPLLACCALLLIVGLARASCPDGAAGCSLLGRPAEADLWDTIHGLSIGIYVLAYVLAAICAGVVLLRRRHPRLAAAMLAIAVLSILAVGQVDEASPGAEQRIWLAVHAIGLLALARFAGSASARRSPAPQ